MASTPVAAGAADSMAEHQSLREQHVVIVGAGPAGVEAARVASESLFTPAFLKEWVMQGSPMSHPAFASVLDRLSADASPPPPVKAQTGQELKP